MKKSLIALFIIILLVGAFIFTACNHPSGEPNHEHTYSKEWTSDEDYHWHSADCGHNETKDKSEHVWDEGAFKNGAECSDDAVFIYTCTICSATKETTKESHSFELIESKEATCTANGYEFYSCAFCKKENWVTLKAEGHKISNPTSEVMPTCDEEGYQEGICDNCNTSVKIELSALGHSELEMNFSDEYCGSLKVGSIVCKICNEVVAEYGHSFIKTVQNATCTADGYIKYECQSCKYSYSETQKSQGHITGSWQQESPATCSAKGTRALYCMVCNERIEITETAMLEHTYSSVVSNGEIVYSCNSCNHSYSITAEVTKEITFESNGGSACAPINANYGSSLELPFPTKEGFDFGGWYYDEGLSNSCGTVINVTESTKLYAAWNKSKIESVSEEKTLYVDVPLTFEFTVITDVELTNDNLSEYVFVKDHNGTPAKIYIASQDGNKYRIASEDYKEVTTYEVFILQSLSFEKSTSNTMWFITDGEKTTSIKYMPGVKHINESDIYSVIQSEEKVYAFFHEDKFTPGDIVVVHGASEEEIVLAMKIVSEEEMNGLYSYEIATASPEEVYEETNIFYSGELDISNIEFSGTLEEDLTAALINSELYAQIQEANIIFASERSTNNVKFTPKEIKIKPKFSVSGTKLYVQYTVSSIFEKETGNRTENFSVSLAISNTTTFSSDVWFHWVDNFSLVFGAKNEFQIDIFATGEMSYENNVEAFKQAFNKAKNSGKWKEISSENANSSNVTKLGNVNIPLNGVTISIELASNFEFKATGEIGISVKVTTDMQFGVRNTSWSGFEFVRSFNTRVDSTFVVRGKLEASYLLELKFSVKFAGVIEAYIKVGAGPYAEVSGMFVVSGSSNGGFNAAAGGLIEIGLKTELTVGVTAKIETQVLWWKIKVVVFDLKHTWDLHKEPLFEFGSDQIALYFESHDNDSANASIVCGKTEDISDNIDKNMIFQKVDKLQTTVSEVSCYYYLNENYNGIALTPEGVLSYSNTNFTHGDYIDIKIKVVYGSVYKITTLRLELCHNARSANEVAPTCTTDGNTAYIYCHNCDAIISGENSIIPALGHSFSDEWSYDDEGHWHSATCSHSQLTEDYEDHTWDEGEITVAASCFANGEMTYTCTVCDTTKTEALDFLPHDFDENGICKICKEGSPFTFEPITDTTCEITGLEEGKEIVEAIIPTTIKGYTVTSISSGAFKGQTTIKNVTIPNTVTSIGLGAFENCSGITKLTVPFTGGSLEANTHLSYIFGGTTYNDSSYVPESLETVIVTDTTVVTKRAFYNCSTIAKIEIPSTVVCIDSYAFQNCSSLTSITISNNLTNINDGAFKGCTSLANVYYVGTLEQWCNISFWGPASPLYNGATLYINGNLLTELVIPDTVTEIKNFTFYNCDSLTSVTLPNSVTSIGHYAFFNCASLTNITLPDSLSSIESFAFYNCASLTNLTLPDNVTNIGDYAFNNCTSLASINIRDIETWCNISFGSLGNPLCTGAKLYLNGSLVTEIVIPDTVAEIKDCAFQGYTSLTSITIPNNMTRIGDYAFNACVSLTNIALPDSLTTIGSYAFYDCTSLTNITLPDNLTIIGKYAFNNCISFTNITLPNSVTTIGISAFNNCTSLASISFSNSVTKIHKDAFNGCASLGSINYFGSIEQWCAISFDFYSNPLCNGAALYLNNNLVTELVIPDTVTEINDYTFFGCTSLTSITLPNSVTEIGSYSFYGCTSLTSITLPETMSSIGFFAFGRCTSLANITLPDSVSRIKSEAFRGCTALTSIIIPDGITHIENGTFQSCSSLTSIIIPDSITSIGNHAFSGCTSLTEILLPDGITSIGSYAFNSCYLLANIKLPSNLTSIGSDAFYYCSSLINIIIPDSVTSIGSDTFYACSSLSIYCEATTQPAEWDADWNISNRPVYWYSESVPTTEGNYWHYVNGSPVIWE